MRGFHFVMAGVNVVVMSTINVTTTVTFGPGAGLLTMLGQLATLMLVTHMIQATKPSPEPTE